MKFKALVLGFLLLVSEVASAAGGYYIAATGITTNTTSPVFQIPSNSPSRYNFYAELTGTGAITQTLSIYGTVKTSATFGVLLGTITLSGTTSTQDATAVLTSVWPNYYVVTTNTTGTGASGGLYFLIP